MFSQFNQWEKMKKILTLLLLSLLCANAYSFDWNRLSDSIAEKQKSVSDTVFYRNIDKYRDMRKYFSLRRYLDSTIVVGDTLIIMEFHRPYIPGALNITMWIKGKPESFMTYGEYGDYNRDFTMCFWSIYSRKLCENWDIAKIREEEREHPSQIEPFTYKRATVIATRVIFRSEDDFFIDTISFGDFRLYPRDDF